MLLAMQHYASASAEPNGVPDGLTTATPIKHLVVVYRREPQL